MGKKIHIYLLVPLLIFSAGNSYTLTANNLKSDIVYNKLNAQPRLVFEEQVYDFGKIYIGGTISHDFKFKNSGDGELIINGVKSSCGCTAALVSKNKLIINEEGQVNIKFSSGRYVGKVTKSVIVNSNDPENPKYKLTIKGEVIEEVAVIPKLINFGIIRKGDAGIKDIEIRTVPELNVEVKKVESPVPYITITPLKTTDNSLKYQVAFSKYDYIGKFTGIVFVYTSSNKQERIDIPFSGEVVGDVTYYPEVLSFGNIKKCQDSKKTLIINFVNKDVKIEKVEVNPAGINFTVTELNNSSKKLDVKVDENRESGEINGCLRIYTTSTIQPVISIPINGKVEG